MLKKIGYLTVDDAPSEDFKRKVDFLFSKNIPAIFFCRGDLLEQRPKEVIYAIRKKFVIGNHSYNHPHFSEITLEECFKQIKMTDEIIDSLYQRANVERSGKVFRFPYGDKGGGNEAEDGWPEEQREFMQAIQDFLRELGYKQPKFADINYQWYSAAGLLDDVDVYWTYYSCDCEVAAYRLHGTKNPYGYHTLESIINRMDEDVPEGCRGLNFAGSNDIILVHDYPGIEDLFVPIIEGLLTKGIQFELPIFD